MRKKGGVMSEDFKKNILEMLRQHNTMTITTVNDLGRPEAAAVFYVNNNFDLFFLSKPESRHAKNIGEGANCAVTIQKDYSNWQDIKGLQLEGWVEPLQGAINKTVALKDYTSKYIFLNDLLVEGHKLYKAFKKAKIYKVSPKVIWVTDNSNVFGKREELIL